ncbi:MAG: 3-keto-disaccharide hydrolase [Pirellulaceae bacterium]
MASLVFAVASAGSAHAQTSGYRLPLVLGPQAQPGTLLAGRSIREDDRIVLPGGSCLLLSEYRFGDCVLELDYQLQGFSAAAPVFMVRAERRSEWMTLAGPAIEIGPVEQPRARRWRGSRRAAGLDRSWKHVRIAVQGESARAWVDGRPFGTVCCPGDCEGLLAVRVVGDASASLALSNVQVTETGFTSLFNGRDLSEWEGGGSDASSCWIVQDGLLQCTGADGPWLRSRNQFGNFTLRLEYRVQAGGNSGVYVRVPADGDHHGQDAGIEVQILDDYSPRYRDLQPYQFSASLYAIAPATPGSAYRAGAWNSLEIHCHDDRYKISHNGQVVVDVSQNDYPELTERLTKGFLGLQNHSEAVWFRHLRIRSLP